MDAGEKHLNVHVNVTGLIRKSKVGLNVRAYTQEVER